MRVVRYLTIQQILHLHQKSLSEWGGQAGVRDQGLFESAWARPQQSYMGEDAYSDLFEKVATLMESLAKNHPFFDGNKRTALLAGILFLNINGWQLKVSNETAVEKVLQIATSQIKFKELANWLKEHSQKI